jgi:hypothetical protein
VPLRVAGRRMSDAVLAQLAAADDGHATAGLEGGATLAIRPRVTRGE